MWCVNVAYNATDHIVPTPYCAERTPLVYSFSQTLTLTLTLTLTQTSKQPNHIPKTTTLTPTQTKRLAMFGWCLDARGLVPVRDRQSIASADSIQVSRLRRAGAIVVGKTNTPADGHIAITKNLLGPPSCNPWALDRSPGGSSGGAAAAVAACMVPWATASDGGGSIRIPAALTGTFGLKVRMMPCDVMWCDVV